MTPVTKQPHNLITDTSAHNIGNTHTHTLWQRSLVTIALLVTCVLGVKAEQYVIYYQQNKNTTYYMKANVDGTLTSTTTFDAATCVWEGPAKGDSGPLSITIEDKIYYLDKVYNAYTLTITESNYRSTWKISEDGTTLSTNDGTFIVSTYYIYYNNGWLTHTNKTSGQNVSLSEYVTGPTIVEPTSITINPKSISLLVGEETTVTYTISPEGAHEDIQYTINNNNVASVNENGKITAKSVGNTTLRVTAHKSDDSEACYDECEITVTILDPTEIIVDDINLMVDETGGISYTLQPAGAYDRVEFYIADESIASIGLNDAVIGKKAGSTSLTATAYKYNGDVACSATSTISVVQRCATPTIHIERTTKEVTITCSEPADATIYYTTDGTDPTITPASQVYARPFTITGGMVKAIAVRDGWADSHVGIATLGGNGENAGDPYQVSSTADLNYVSQHPTYHYKVVADFDASGFSGAIADFSGTFDGGFYAISGLTSPLFATTSGATIKNVTLKDVDISGTGNVGAIVSTASGATRIYNCGVLSGEVGGGTNVGSIAGSIDGTARVINCYSFANITGGTTVGGIVGYNSVASTASNLKTLVMNCMFYGDITGTNIYPIFGGNDITNNSGINTYNFFRLNSTTQYKGYNHTQAITEDSYLTRFEFYRHILNSHRELAAYYAFNNVDKANEIGKWALDKSRAPYPIVTKHLSNTRKTLDRTTPSTQEDYVGKKIKDINVTININGTQVYNGTLPMTDMNTAEWDYTYGKVVLPFANEFTGWSIGDAEAITGWKVSTKDYYQDLNSVFDNTNYVYAQGGNYIVPEGVESITLTAYVAPAVYLSDANYDVVYNSSYTNSQGRGGATPTTYKEQPVYNNLAAAIDALPYSGNNEKYPYKQAIVLVGNYHYNQKIEDSVLPASINYQKFNINHPFTLMSADEDCDQEPDYCFYQFHAHGSGRTMVHPIRFDFLTAPGIGMAAHIEEGQAMPSVGIWHCKGWFEQTETFLAYMSECEIRPAYFLTDSPWILNGGIFEQIVSTSTNEYGTQYDSKLSYIKIGGNAYVKEFHPGTHSGYDYKTKLKPVYVSGGEIRDCYMTGKEPNVNANTEGDVYFYCNGGYIHEFLGAYLEKQNGKINVTMDHALVDNFYGGGASETHGTNGHINLMINNSYINFFCGGPKYGNMAEGKTITVTANGTTFGGFYGGGYGGTALTRKQEGAVAGGDLNLNGDVEFPISFTTYTNKRLTNVEGYGVGVGYDMAYFLYAGGSGQGVARFCVDYARLSLAQTNQISSTLENCTILNDFYGGGCQGRVNGAITSVLTDCEVMGSAFAGGYTAAATPISVYPTTPPTYSKYIKSLGSFTPFGTTTPETYTWKQATTEHTAGSVEGNSIYTDVDMTKMGEVDGNTTIEIKGANSHIHGSVFGGGNASKVIGNTKVHIKDGRIDGNVFGAGNQASVTGKTDVIIGDNRQ